MNKVIALDAFRRDRQEKNRGLRPRPKDRPPISDVDIWGRNYCTLDDVVHGILKIHQIVSHYVYPDEYWMDALLCLLDAANHARGGDFVPLRDAAERVSGMILLWMDEFNRKDMYAALIILGLIEKSPVHQAAEDQTTEMAEVAEAVRGDA